MPPSRPRPSRLASSLGALAVLAVLASGCAAEPSGTPIAAAASTAAGPSSSGLAPFADVDATEVTVVADVSIPGLGSAVDVCLPPGSGAGGAVRPAVLAVHGGSWARGDRAHEAWRAVCEWLAVEGLVGVSVGYRLAPEFPFPAGVDDVAAALASTQDPHFAARFGIDSARVALFGGSAGGNLAALVGLRDGLSGAGAVSAVVSLSAPSTSPPAPPPRRSSRARLSTTWAARASPPVPSPARPRRSTRSPLTRLPSSSCMGARSSSSPSARPRPS
ncbi:alpha/beta hydrolase [Microcella pacifica]|uniref:alpha/beta hydrolase n=1 Tax=Microcella pacifica TaxID=2591847 RepID=UPI0013F61B7E|nr:alpha/beta hydrolase [Microcella pacifica]